MMGPDEMREVYEAQLLQTMHEIAGKARSEHPDDIDAQMAVMREEVNKTIVKADQDLAATLWLSDLHRIVHAAEAEGKL